MKASIGVQLWSVRELIDKDFKGTLKRIAGMGFQGVELAGFYGRPPKQTAKLLKSLGLKPLGIHHMLSTEKEDREAFKKAKELGIKRFVVPYLDPVEFKDPAKISAFCDKLNKGSRIARKYGLSLGFHNHNAEFAKDKGKVRFENLSKRLDPKVYFEIDTYWVKAAGQDPAKWVARLGKRAPLLHMKDGPAKSHKHGSFNVPLGEGDLNFPAIVKAAKGRTEWLIVEFDQCKGDVMKGLEKSYKYLVKNNWVKGR